MSIHEKITFAGLPIWSRKFTENTIKAWSDHHLEIKPPDTLIYSHKGVLSILKGLQINQHNITGHYVGPLNVIYTFRRSSVEFDPSKKKTILHKLHELFTGPRHAH